LTAILWGNPGDPVRDAAEKGGKERFQKRNRLNLKKERNDRKREKFMQPSKLTQVRGSGEGREDRGKKRNKSDWRIGLSLLRKKRVGGGSGGKRGNFL